MIITQHKDRVELGGISQTSGATILATGHAFEILSSGLYPDKPKAILREIANNAYDAHVAAGIADRPIHVQLPNDLEPELVIRDYGDGLAHAAMMSLYVTYFGSLKNESNDFIGGLGLGSKSPWSYTKQFIVVSRHKGMKRTYSAYIGEDGCPGIALLHEEPNDEPDTGLEVRVPIQRNDYSVFADKAQDVFTYWKVKPRVTGRKNFTFNEVDYSMIGEGWALRRIQDYSYRGQRDSDQPRAIMGTTAYPIEKQHFSGLTAKNEKLFDIPFDITFPIGDLAVAPSREGLQYTSRVQKTILDALESAANKMVASYETLFDDVETLWEARVRFRDRITAGGLSYQVRELINGKLSFKGHTLQDEVLLRYDRGGFEGLTFLNLTAAYDRSIKKQWQKEGEKYARVAAMKDTVFVWDDRSKTKLVDRLQFHFGSDTPLFVIRTKKKEYLQQVLAELGNPAYENINAKEDPPREFSQRVRPVTRKLLTYRAGQWADTSHDVAQGGLYVPLYLGDPTGPVGANDWNNFLVNLETLGIRPDEPIFGIQATYRNIPDRYDGWRLLHDEIKKQLPEIMEKEDFEQALGNLEEWNNLSTDLYAVYARRLPIPAKDKSRMRRLQEGLDALQPAANNAKKIHAIKFLLQRYDIPFKAKAPTAKLKPLLDAAKKKYPMLSLMGRFPLDPDQAKTVADYVDIADRSR